MEMDLNQGAAWHGIAENKALPLSHRLSAALQALEDIDYLLMRLAEEINEVNVANGWFEGDRSFGDDVALLHTEVSELYESYRNREPKAWLRHADDCIHAPLNKIRDLLPHREGCTCSPKPEGAGSEAADIFIRLLDTCLRHDINLGQQYRRKIAYNRTRGHRHGGKRF